MAGETKLKRLFIGTSGWSYRHWSEIFYPKDLKPDKYLEHYITKFSCVELNSSFYHLPLKTTVAGWMIRTPDTFRFCTKLNRFITHQLKLINIEGALENYFDVFKGMKDRLGPVLVQLPPGFSFDKPLLSGFLDLIKEQYSQYRFAVEVRHESWINDSCFDLLARHGVAFVIADSGNRYPYYDAVTAGFVYMRFHGREKLYASDYSETDLQPDAKRIMNWLDEDKEVWVFFNNDYGGYAVKDAERLKQMVCSE